MSKNKPPPNQLWQQKPLTASRHHSWSQNESDVFLIKLTGLAHPQGWVKLLLWVTCEGGKQSDCPAPHAHQLLHWPVPIQLFTLLTKLPPWSCSQLCFHNGRKASKSQSCNILLPPSESLPLSFFCLLHSTHQGREEGWWDYVGGAATMIFTVTPLPLTRRTVKWEAMVRMEAMGAWQDACTKRGRNFTCQFSLGQVCENFIHHCQNIPYT